MKRISAAMKHGYLSGLEEKNAELLKAKGIDPQYEQFVLQYIKPTTKHRYTVDFQLPNGILVETKGRFTLEDRKKHLLVQEQHPELDIRFVFTNPNARITKTSKTTYSMWCDKNNFKWAAKLIPEDWINE